MYRIKKINERQVTLYPRFHEDHNEIPLTMCVLIDSAALRVPRPASSLTINGSYAVKLIELPLCSSAARYGGHREDHHKQSDSFNHTDDHQIVPESLPRLGKCIGRFGPRLSLEKSGESHR